MSVYHCGIVYNLYYCCYAKTSSPAVQIRHSKVYGKPYCPSFYSILLGSGGMIVLYLCAQLAVLYTHNCLLILIYYRLGPEGMIVLYLCAQLAVLYTYNCLLILIYYSLGQNILIINKYAVRSRYSLWPIKLVKD